MQYEVTESRDVPPGEWRAEAIDYDSEGECYVTIFAGPDAEQRARAYAQWMNTQEPTVANTAPLHR